MYVNSAHKKAQKLMDEEKFEKALDFFNEALEINPNHPDILSHRGVLYLHLNQKKKCFDDLELSRDLDKNHGYRYACLAYAHEYFGDLDTAIIFYEEAVRIDPEDAISYNSLGLLREKKGYQKKANEDFERADKLAKIQEGLFQKIDELERSGLEEEPKKNPLPKPGSLQIPDGERLQPKKLTPDPKPTFSQVSKEVFTNKSMFKEFINFVKNGFKLDKK